MDRILGIVRQRGIGRVESVPLEVIPKTRDELRMMKAEREEAERKECIEEVVSWLYQRIIGAAKRSSETCYKLQLLTESSQHSRPAESASRQRVWSDPNEIYYTSFILEASDEIVQRLRETFPECAVEIKTLSKGADGKMYDASTLDEVALRFVDKRNNQTTLVVDWS